MRSGAGTQGARRTGVSVLSVVLVLSTGDGCSWLFTQPLPAQYSRYDIPPCSTNLGPPVVDTIFAVTNTASALYVATLPNVTNKEQAVSLGISVALLWALSASYGYRHTSECEDAHRGRPVRSWRPPPPRAVYGTPPPPPAISPATAPPSPASDLPSGVATPPNAPAPIPAPAAAPARQRQDDDDPDTRRDRPPRPQPAPTWGPRY